MKRSHIYIVIGLMTLAVAGLSFVQVRYLQNTVALKEAQFHYTVDMALSQVGQELHEYSSKQQFLQSQEGRQALAIMDSMRRASSQGTPNSAGYFVRDTVVVNEDGSVKMSYSTFYSGAESSSKRRALPPANMRYKHTWLEDFIGGMFSDVERPRAISDLEYEVVDSIAHHVFDGLGIDTELDLAVFNAGSQPLLYDGRKGLGQLSSLRSAQHRLRLPEVSFSGENEFLHVGFPRETRFIMSSVWPLILSSGTLLLIIIAAFAFTIFVILRQKKLSEIKNDFINNMTHELKTPVSTIALACEALADPDMQAMPNAQDRYLGMIRSENHRLGQLVENVLQSAIVDRGQLKLSREELTVDQLILEAVASAELAVRKRDGAIKVDLMADSHRLMADMHHIRNVIDNLLDNAIKYSPDAPEISVQTSTVQGALKITVRDQGIGISKDNQKRIFDTLYRVPKGNTHDVKGFGLGLSYVKEVVKAHGGQIHLQSKPQQGTSISIKIPQST